MEISHCVNYQSKQSSTQSTATTINPLPRGQPSAQIKTTKSLVSHGADITNRRDILQHCGNCSFQKKKNCLKRWPWFCNTSCLALVAHKHKQVIKAGTLRQWKMTGT
jgi:hypothetical protein